VSSSDRLVSVLVLFSGRCFSCGDLLFFVFRSSDQGLDVEKHHVPFECGMFGREKDYQGGNASKVCVECRWITPPDDQLL